jgi:hypothetical protein
LIARQFAETGFKDLFVLILKLVCQHQDKEAQIRVSGKWITIDPRAWRNQFDLSINVGLGTGNKDQQVQHLMALVAAQQQAFPMQIVTPKNIFESHKKLSEALGYKQENLFFSDPTDPQTKSQMPPPPPDPEQAKMQHQGQLEQMKAQTQGQQKQAEIQATAQLEQMKSQTVMQIEREKMQMQAQVDQHRQEVEAQQQNMKMEKEAQLRQFEAELDMQKDQAKLEHQMRLEQLKQQAAREIAELEASVKIQVAQIGAQTAMDSASLSAQQTAATEITNEVGKPDPFEQLAGMHGEMMQGIAGLVNTLANPKPKTIIRGPDGRAIGVQ